MKARANANVAKKINDEIDNVLALVSFANDTNVIIYFVLALGIYCVARGFVQSNENNFVVEVYDGVLNEKMKKEIAERKESANSVRHFVTVGDMQKELL